MTPSPKARFLASKENISAHREMVDSTEFQRASDFSMLSYSALLASQATDGNNAMAVGLKLLGAQEFLATMRELAESPQNPPKIARLDNLNHTV